MCFSSSLPEKKTSVKVMDGEKTLISATGEGINGAFLSLLEKLEQRILNATTPERVSALIDQMESAHTETCSSLSRYSQEKYESIHGTAKQKYRRLLDEKQAAKKVRQEKQRDMSEHKRMVNQQRRLMTDSLRYDIFARDGFRCQICGASAAEGAKLHVDHIFPVSKGGKTEPGNLQTLCERCNLGKSNKIMTTPIPAPSSITDSTPIPTPPAESDLPHQSSEQEYIDLTPEEFMRLFSSSAECTQDECTPQTAYTTDELIEQLSKQGIKYLDKRNQGGCLWIEMTKTSEQLLDSVTVDGKPVYRASSAKAFSKAPAFFIK